MAKNRAAESGQFIDESEAQERVNGLHLKEGVAKAARQGKTPREQAEEEADLGSSAFDPALDIDPAELFHKDPPKKSQPTSQQEPPSRQSTHSPSLARRAKEMGFTDEEIASYDSETLDEMVWKLRDKAQPRVEQPTLQKSNVEQPPAPPPEPEEDPYAWLDDKMFPEYASNIKKAIKKSISEATAELREELKAAKAELAQVTSHLDRQATETVHQQIDRTFNEMGPAWTKVLGKGTIGEVGKAQKTTRNAIVSHAQQLAKQNGGTITSHLKAAAQALYGQFVADEPETPKKPAQRRVSREEIDVDAEIEGLDDEWENAGLHRPTNRRQPELPKGRERAMRRVSERFREAGQDIYGSGTEENGIPD